ncbi:hypothetical protein FN846DRAFT_785792 [Sphaerosporella brunnea]|uniref:COX assembly mitochondrial protein n=1 Tax=Sphaerosporella brunnea TaxID=1250544 RepID=A0A5J5EI23_9PEZI|nr:hypothetical protein FN846DRAFT_785792 [Sphaerosporella brunnea]
MGWFWNSSDDDKSPKDTFSHLSPETREFLEREAPLKPSQNQVPSTPAAATQHEPTDPTKYSRYGTKYADIWAQYRPLAEIEAEARTPSMAVNDVYQSYKDRKAAITRAALENCAFEQEVLRECYGGGVKLFFGGCTKENRTLEGCFKGQQGFLKALGYMSVPNRDPDVEEQIQMHADKLYREQVRQENEIAEKAKSA